MSKVTSALKFVGSLNLSKVMNLFHTHRDRIAGGIEQILASLVSMVGLIFLSRLMSLDNFGILAIATGIWLIIEMLQDSVIISPFILSCPKPRDNPFEFGAWLALNIAASFAVPLVLLVLGSLLLPLLPELAQGIMLSAAMTFVGILYMFARRVHYHHRDRKSLLTQTLIYGVSYILALLAVVQYVEVITPVWGALILTFAYGIPGLIFTLKIATQARFSREIWQRIRRERRLIIELGTAGSIWQLAYTSTLVLLSALGTPAAVAIFSITRTLVRPITIIISTLLAVDFSSAVRTYKEDGTVGLHRVIKNLWLASSFLIVVPMALLLIFPEFFLTLIYSEKYAHATLELQLRALLFIPIIYGAPLDIGLSVLRETKFLVRAHFTSLMIGLAALMSFYAFGYINATTALASLGIGRLLVLPMMHNRYFALIGKQTKTVEKQGFSPLKLSEAEPSDV